MIRVKKTLKQRIPRYGEDFLCVQKYNDNELLLAVADGLGGSGSGKRGYKLGEGPQKIRKEAFLSSRFVIAAVKEFFKDIRTRNALKNLLICGRSKKWQLDFKKHLKDHINDTLKKVEEKSVAIGPKIYSSMKKTLPSTLSLVYLYNNKLLIINIGDSRVYMNRNNEITLLTKDDSDATSEEDSFENDPPMTQVISLSKNYTLNIFTHELEETSGYLILLVSDGAYNYMHPNNFRNLIKKIDNETETEYFHRVKSEMTRVTQDDLSFILVNVNDFFKVKEEEIEKLKKPWLPSILKFKD